MSAPQVRAGRRNQSSAAASSVALLGAVVTTIASFLIAYLVSSAGREVAGAFFLATAVLSVAGNSMSLGTTTSLVYFMPRALTEDEPNPRALIRQTLQPIAILSLAAAALIFVAAPWLADLVADSRQTDIAMMIRVASPAIPAWALTAGLLGASRGLGSMNPTVLINQILRPGGQLLLIGILYIGDDPEAWQLGAAWMIPVLVGLFVALVGVIKLGGAEGSGPSIVSPSEFWSYSRPRALSTALQIALERIDILIVGALLGTQASGTYGALTRYIAAGNFLIYAVAQSSSFSLRKEIAADNLDRARGVLRQTTSWLMLLAWPYFLVVALKPEPLANLLSNEYVPDAEILSILAVGMMVSAAAGPIDSTLLMLGRSGLGLAGVAAAIVTDIALLLLLAPRYGLVGAAIAWAAAVVVQNALASWFVGSASGLSSMGKPWLIAAGLALVAVVPVATATGQSFVDLLIVGGVALPVLLVGVWVFRDDLGLGGQVRPVRRDA